MTVITASSRIEWHPTTSWVDITSHIQNTSGNTEFSGNRSNALSYGDYSDTTREIETIDLTLQNTAYNNVPIREYNTINGVEAIVFSGIITGRERTLDGLTFHCEGLRKLISRTRIYSPMFERVPAATKTSSSSIENPSLSSYNAGLINYALWKSGLRPYEQISSYPLSSTVKGYYSIPEYSILAPDYAWLANEDTWEECLKLCRAVGGQLRQDRDGVIRYIQPLSYGNSTATYTFDETVYGDLKEGTLSEQTATRIICPVIPRTKQLVQEVINDDTPRRIPGGLNQTLIVTLEPQQPIAKNGWVLVKISPTSYRLPVEATKLVLGDGSVPIIGTHYLQTVTTAAQQIQITFRNLTSLPITVTHIIVKGKPVVAGEVNTVSGGVEGVDMNIPDNPYIQSISHAERLIAMMLAFHSSNLPIITASDCVQDINRVLGESVNVTASDWSLSAVKHLIVGKREEEMGTSAEYDLVNVSSLPASDEFFKVGLTNYSGLIKKLGY